MTHPTHDDLGLREADATDATDATTAEGTDVTVQLTVTLDGVSKEFNVSTNTVVNRWHTAHGLLKAVHDDARDWVFQLADDADDARRPANRRW